MPRQLSEEEIDAIQEFNEWYQNDDKWGKKRERELERKRKEFVKHFSPGYIAGEMPKDEYLFGKGNTKSFCYMLERGLEGLGSIRNATADKFGLYFSRKNNNDHTIKRFQSTDREPFEIVKEELLKLITAAKNNNPQEVSKSLFCYTVRHKVFNVYNLNNDIPIFSEDDLDLVLRYYEIEVPNEDDRESAKRKCLFNFKNSNDCFRNWSNVQFMAFLYSKNAKIFDQKEKFSKNRKYETVEIVDVNGVADGQRDHYSHRNITQTDYAVLAAKRTFIGNAGEELVLEKERKDHPQYKKMIRRVSLENQHLGYDILSFNDAGEEIHIEVKTKKSGTKDNVDFYITANELEKLNEPNHYIYYVCGITTKRKTIYRISGRLVQGMALTPILYKVEGGITD